MKELKIKWYSHIIQKNIEEMMENKKNQHYCKIMSSRSIFSPIFFAKGHFTSELGKVSCGTSKITLRIH